MEELAGSCWNSTKCSMSADVYKMLGEVGLQLEYQDFHHFFMSDKDCELLEYRMIMCKSGVLLCTELEFSSLIELDLNFILAFPIEIFPQFLSALVRQLS